MNNVGASFLLAYTLILLGFSAMVWYVLYKLPEKHGLISKRNNKEAISLDPKGSYIFEEGGTDQYNFQRDHGDTLVNDLLEISKEEHISGP